MHQHAQRAKPRVSAGIDGWLPVELKALPLAAWEERERVFKLSVQLQTLPEDYEHVTSPCLPKKGQGNKPLDHRLLAVFSAIYRIEMGSWFKYLYKWFVPCLHPDLHGAVPGHEAAEVSWDAQADLEHALINRLKEVLLMVDYYKFFDSFDHAWVRDFLLMLGFPAAYANMLYKMYKNLKRIIKLGAAYGDAFIGYNGMGQGDVGTLVPALAMVSGQFYMVSLHYPSIRKGACIDDRNFRGKLQDITSMYARIAEYDRAAGHFIQPEKTAIAATHDDDKLAIRDVVLDGFKPTLKECDVLTGDIITTSRRKTCTRANNKMHKAYEMAQRLNGTTVSRRAKLRAATVAIIPLAIADNQWCRASANAASKLRTALMQGTFGPGRKLRCIEILSALYFDPTKLDPLFASAYRSFTQCRRLLRKNSERSNRFIADFCNTNRHTNYANGPVNGLSEAAQLIEATVNLINGELCITTPDGITIPINCDQKGYYNFVLREAIKRRIIKHLQQRTTNNVDRAHAHFRKDMVGITTDVDDTATMANFRYKPNKREKRDKKAPVQPVYCQCPKLNHILQSIIAGSIRSPDRLMAANLAKCDKCTCKDCRGARATTEHIFWHCNKYNDVREPFILYAQYLLNKCASEHNEAFQHISQQILLPCFRNCGIMNGTDDVKKAHSELPGDANDRYNDFDPDQMVMPTANTQWKCIDDQWYIVVYTDGSAFNPTSKYLARAGWGVFYANDSEYNKSGPLYGPTQSSYRAEVRAILEVVRTAIHHTIIYSDCDTAVKTTNQIIKKQLRNTDDLADGDFWYAIKEIIDDSPTDFFQCVWIPSHCGDAGNEAKRDKMIASGLINAVQIAGNDQADELAKAGAATFQIEEKTLIAQSYRNKITMTYQNMMVQIWSSFFDEYVNEKGEPIKEDIASDMPALNSYVQQSGSYDDDDYDPFADIVLCDLDGNDLTPTPTPTPQPTTDTQPEVDADGSNEDTLHTELDIKKHYPAYGWSSNEETDLDKDFGIDMPEYPDLQKLNTRKYKVPRNDEQDASRTKLVPYEIWQPLAEWMRKLKWSLKLGASSTTGREKRARSVTWTELTIAFQHNFGYTIISDDTSLAEQVACFRQAFEQLLFHAADERQRKKSNQRYQLGLSARITAIKPLLGVDAPGFSRRPMLPDETWYHVGKNIVRLNEHDCNATGQLYKIVYEGTRTRWLPNSVQEMHNLLQRRANEYNNSKKSATTTTTDAHGTVARNVRQKEQPTKVCYFGHTTTTDKWYTNLLLRWSNVPHGVTLCKRCYLRGRRGRSPPPNLEGKPPSKKSSTTSANLTTTTDSAFYSASYDFVCSSF